MRGFKKIKEANKILDFFDVHYNFIDRQIIKSKKQTPAQAAGFKKNLGTTYNLLRLINYAYAENWRVSVTKFVLPKNNILSKKKKKKEKLFIKKSN